jgi:hypothetical protein
MVACANATYKYEALYALLERLKNSPNAEKMFTAVNHENKVSIGVPVGCISVVPGGPIHQ